MAVKLPNEALAPVRIWLLRISLKLVPTFPEEEAFPLLHLFGTDSNLPPRYLGIEGVHPNIIFTTSMNGKIRSEYIQF